MKMIKILIAILMFFAPAFSQDTIESKDYFDEAKTHVSTIINYYLKDGKKISHGSFKSFYEVGQIKTELNYKDGLKDGVENKYTIDGTKTNSTVWDNGEVVKETLYFLSGTPKMEVEQKSIKVKDPNNKNAEVTKSIKDGAETSYFINGKINTVKHWKDGIPNGVESKWYKNGQKQFEFTWKMGKKDGIESQWFESGKLSSVTNWIDNQAQGEMINYHENGVKKDQLEWDKGNIINERTSWNEKGIVNAKCTYKNGEPFKGTVFDIQRLLILYFEEGKQVDSKVCDKQGKI